MMKRQDVQLKSAALARPPLRQAMLSMMGRLVGSGVQDA